MIDTLHFYQCHACKDTLITVALAAGKVWRCIKCGTPMRRLYDIPVESQREQRWAEYGVVYNPGIATCTVCGIKLTPDIRIKVPDLGDFCSPGCVEDELTQSRVLRVRHG